jgi:hypothetical protein
LEKDTHTEGRKTVATRNSAHAEGLFTVASGNGAHAEGIGVEDKSSPFYDKDGVQQGYKPNENYGAHGKASHSEGSKTLAKGDFSHSEGQNTKAIGKASHSSGLGTIAQDDYSYAGGKYNDYNNVPTDLYNRQNFTNYVNYSTKAVVDKSETNYLKYIGSDTANTFKPLTIESSDTFDSGVKLKYNYNYHIEIEYNSESEKEIKVELFRGYTINNVGGGKNGLNQVVTFIPSQQNDKTITFDFTYDIKTTQNLFIRPMNSESGAISDTTPFIITSLKIVEVVPLLYSVGNGTKEENRSNAFAIYQDGHAEVQTMGATDNSVVTKGYVD